VDNYCTGQCWYDNLVVIPRGNPDAVYLGGSYQYGEYGGKSNSRAVLYSTNAGSTWSDVSWDATTNPTPPGSCCQPNPIAPNGIHPDQHALVVSPTNPGLFFEGSDGGLVRSSGSFSDISSQCRSPRGLTGADLGFCQKLLKRVPSRLFDYTIPKLVSYIRQFAPAGWKSGQRHFQLHWIADMAARDLRRRWPIRF